MEPLRSRTVLQIMDGLRGVWHGGPFARTTRYVFYPRQIMFATDPVAVDRLLLDIIETERRAHGESVAEVEQSLRVGRAPDRIAGKLGVATGAAVIEVERLYRLTSGVIAEVALNVYPADRFELNMTLRRSKA